MSNFSPSREVRTVNAARYRHANARVGIAKCNGLPIAFRRVVALSQPGSFAVTRYQGITAHKITPLSADKMRSLAAELHPLN
jgi:hypothetical protein